MGARGHSRELRRKRSGWHLGAARRSQDFANARELDWLKPVRLCRCRAAGLVRTPLRAQAVESWFENLLPEYTRFASAFIERFQPASSSAFDLLNRSGRDCAGAVQWPALL